jgi:hypothetical protein
MTDGREHMNGTTAPWASESPFLSDGGAGGVQTARAPTQESFALDSPFLSGFSANGSTAVRTPQAEAFSDMLEALHDESLGEALAAVADETSALSETPLYEGEAPAKHRQRQQQIAQAYLDQLGSRAQASLQQLRDRTAGTDLAAMSEAGLSEYLEGFTPDLAGGSPAAEQFLGSIWKRAKKAIGAAAKLAKKGITAVAGMLPHTWLLNKLIGLVPMLLKRVLRLAIDRLPVSLQPIAKQLAARFLKTEVSESEDEGEHDEAASADARMLATEFDTLVAGYAVEGEEFDRAVNMEALMEDRTSAIARDALRELDGARSVFVSQLSRSDEGEDPMPAVEQFVPAILAALKLGVRIIGRPKIVRFLSGHLSRLIRPYIGPDNARTLSGALVDAGMKLVHLEAESESDAATRVAGETIAATLEDTVARLAQSLPASEWESETMLEAYTRDALESAVAANFPDNTVRSELHEAGEVKGVWRRPRGQRYKKYTRIPSIVLTPQIARAIPSFRGVPLRSILRDRYGIVGPIRVHVHLYEAVPGTMPGAITRAESQPGGPESTAASPSAASTGTPADASSSASSSASSAGDAAAGGAEPASESEFHPLTEAAAGLLLREPGLGRDVSERFLETPQSMAVGQRFYRLSIEGGRPRSAAQSGRIRRVRAHFDLRRGVVSVRIFFSEAAAQEIAQAFRRKAPPGVILNLFRRVFTTRDRAQAEGEADTLHVSSESQSESADEVSRRVRRRMPASLRRLWQRSVVKAIATELERRYAQLASQFDTAANARADGVTVRITLRGVPWLSAVRRLASRTLATREDEDTTHESVSTHEMEAAPGYLA